MKLVTYLTGSRDERLGLMVGDGIVDLKDSASKIGGSLPPNILEFLLGGEKYLDQARKVEEAFAAGRLGKVLAKAGYRLLSPVPHPPSMRDGYAFRQHVATARRNRGLEMIPEFDQFPVFYFTNHLSVTGEGDVIVEEDHLEQLDFELECAIVIGKRGRNIDAAQADQYVAGLMIMNDLSARVLQMDEMKLSLGPAKGKDFATACGPWLVTLDELTRYQSIGPRGATWDLRMSAYHNGKLVSLGNLKDMNWTFAEIIERASYGVELQIGDIIGSGTVGTGCYLELNGTRTLTAKERGESYSPVWLQEGDTIELEITGLGRLSNRIVRSPHRVSILRKKRHTAP